MKQNQILKTNSAPSNNRRNDKQKAQTIICLVARTDIIIVRMLYSQQQHSKNLNKHSSNILAIMLQGAGRDVREIVEGGVVPVEFRNKSR